jgi:precorrin-4/cobalt-precorrin-4 C11-methyltransferase
MTTMEVAPFLEVLPPLGVSAHSARASRPLSIHLTIHSLDRLMRDLLPFYGEDCPVAVMYDDHGPGEITQGTLATMCGWTDALSARRPMRVLVG